MGDLTLRAVSKLVCTVRLSFYPKP